MYSFGLFLCFCIIISQSLRRVPGLSSLSRRSLSMSAFKAPPNPNGFTLQQTMLRIKDPALSVPWYEKFGFKLLHRFDFEEWKFSLYFMGILPEGQEWPAEVPSKESAAAIFDMKMGQSTIELTHNWGTETDDAFKVNSGNAEPYRGFGHLAVMTPDVYEASESLEASGVKFQKRPDEGRMKGLAFALDPDGYWMEIVKRSENSCVSKECKYTLAQTMLRIKDPVKSLAFYRDVLGMTLLRETHFPKEKGDFSLYFLAQLPPGADAPDPAAPGDFITSMYPQVLELTHNHGTEDDPAFKYHNGNDEDPKADPPMLRGFGHTGFLTDDLSVACEFFDEKCVPFKKRPEEGGMKGLAFVYDPDGYAVEIIQRGFQV